MLFSRPLTQSKILHAAFDIRGPAFIPLLGVWIVLCESIGRSGWFALVAFVTLPRNDLSVAY